MSLSCAIDVIWCMMLCYAKWCDDVMLCEMIFAPKIYTHPHSWIFLPFIFRLHRLFFGVSALTFRSKFCIPLGTSLELLRLLLRRYQRWLFAVCSAFLLERLWSRKLTLRSLRNDFLWLRQTYSAFLRTTFCCFEGFSIVRRSFLLSQACEENIFLL